MLTPLDLGIILGYLLCIIVIGLIARSRAKRGKDEYLLGGKSIPWYLLSLSNASGMFDISGTIWLVTLMFVYGIKSVWIPWLWPVFNQIFLMVYLSKWLRRSNVTTGAEWMATRFGNGPGTKRSHIVVVLFALVVCLGYLAYGFIGLGKFMEIFIPWETVAPYFPVAIPTQYVPHVYGAVFTLFAVCYSLLGGMRGIVWADVLQFTLMGIAAVLVGYLGFAAVGADGVPLPAHWMDAFTGGMAPDWKSMIPEVTQKIKKDGYGLFGIFFSMLLFKGILVSMAGPIPTYDMQKILSTKSPADASKMSGFSSVFLMPFRYLMVAGFAALALVYYEKLDLTNAGLQIDLELLLPSAIQSFVPVGLMGILLAGLIAAFISTFAGTLNAAQAYLVNDIYLKYQNPNASAKQIRNATYLSGIFLVVVGTVVGFCTKNVNSVLNIIVSVIFGSYVAANVLKWYWWRFNTQGFFWGMVTGMVSAWVIPTYFFPDTNKLYLFPILLLISLLGSIAGTYASSPTPLPVLQEFYKTVRPWGLWAPIQQQLQKENPSVRPNPHLKRDFLNILLGIIAQTTLVLLPMYVVFRQFWPAVLVGSILLLCLFLLKRFWWDTLEDSF